MKKLLALFLMAVMVISASAVSFSATAEDVEYSKTIVDFDTVVPSIIVNGNTTTEVVDYTTVDSSYAYGKALKVNPAQWQSFYLGLPLTWKEGNPTALKFTIIAETDITLNRSALGISNSSTGTPTYDIDALGGGDFSGHLTVSAGNTYDVVFDLTKINLSNINYNAWIALKSEHADRVIYIDNIKAVYAKESDIPNYTLNGTVIEDFEDGTAGKLETVGTGNYADYTSAPYNGSISLRAGKKSWDNGNVGNDFSQNYVAYPLTNVDMSEAYNISFAYKAHFDWGQHAAFNGIRINGKDYWRSIPQKSDWETTDMFYNFYSYIYVQTDDEGNKTIVTDNDQSIWLTPDLIKQAEAILFSAATWFDNCYVLVDDITLEKRVDNNPTTDNNDIELSMQTGASIRLGAVNGIRFYTNVDSTKLAALKTGGATVQLGTLIAPADLITGEELTFDLDSSKYIDVQYTADELYTETGFTGIVGSIASIKESNTSYSATSGNITRDFVGRGYIKITKDGTTTVKYATYANSSIANNSRSLKTVASELRADLNNQTLYNNYKDIVDAWADAVR